MDDLGEKYNSQTIRQWLMSFVGYEHLADIKEAKSLDAYTAIAPDSHVLAMLASTALGQASQMKEEAEITLELTNVSRATKEYAYGQLYASRRVIRAMRTILDQYRLENPEYEASKVLDDTAETPVE